MLSVVYAYNKVIFFNDDDFDDDGDDGFRHTSTSCFTHLFTKFACIYLPPIALLYPLFVATFFNRKIPRFP